MVQRRLAMLAGGFAFLLFGLFTGLTIERLWFDSGRIAAPLAQQAQAVTRPAEGEVAHPAIPQIDKSNRITQVVEAISPSVVTVGAVKRTVVAQPWLNDFLLFPSVRYSQRLQRMPYLGSGFIIDDEGRVLTNFHVIEDSENIFVTIHDGREFPAKLIDADRYVDVALLQIDSNGEELPPPLTFADSDELRIGEQVVAFGNPFGPLMEDVRPTVTVGYISALKRTFRPDRQNNRVYQDMIQTDAAINPGNSGGPLVDVNGKVAGVNTFIFSPSGASAGIGFAIPANRVSAFVQEVKDHGRLRPLLLDFAFRSVRTPNGPAVQVLGMEPGGPAASAGLQPGDLLISVDGRRISNREEFYLIFASKQVGDKVRLEVARPGGQTFQAEYTINEAVEI